MTDQEPAISVWMSKQQIQAEYGWSVTDAERVMRKCRLWRADDGRKRYALRVDVERASKDGVTPWSQRLAS